MRTKEEVIKSYMNVDDLTGIIVPVNGEMIKDIMNLWGEEILKTIKLEVEKVNKAMYPDPEWKKENKLQSGKLQKESIEKYQVSD